MHLMHEEQPETAFSPCEHQYLSLPELYELAEHTARSINTCLQYPTQQVSIPNHFSLIQSYTTQPF